MISGTLLYDGDCGFCERWCRRMRDRGAEECVHFAPCLGAVELRAAAGVSDEACARGAVFVEVEGGEVRRTAQGAAAINAVLVRLPGSRNRWLRGLGRLGRLPGVRHLAEIGYRIIARNRFRLGRGPCRTSF